MVCKNCNTGFNDTQNFCSNCGEKTSYSRITIRSILKQFNREFLSIDNKLLRTFKDLLIRPEFVIDYYLKGLRERYVNLISYLALSITLFGFQFFVMNRFYAKEIEENQSSTGNVQIDAFAKLINEQLSDYIGVITIVFIPIVALCTYLIFKSKALHNYAEHIVINTYITAQYTIIFILVFFLLLPFGVDVMVNFTLMSLLSYTYIGYCFKRIYNLTILETIGKTLIAFLTYSIITGIIFAIIIILAGIILMLFFKDYLTSIQP